MSKPERWLPVVGYEGFYEVSDLGQVRSVPRLDIRKIPRGGKLLKPQLDIQTGYWAVKLCKDGVYKRRYVHALVLEAFVGPCPAGMECCHGDDDRQNARLDNLRWDTPQANADDRVARSRTARGEANGGGGKLTENKVRQIKALIGKKKGTEIAIMFGINKATVYDIAKGRKWSHINE